MEISERELRRLVGEADDEHRGGRHTLARDVAELHAATRTARPTPRREFLATAGALTIGAAVVPFGSLLATAGAAAAQEDDEVLTDAQLAGFAESLELLAVEAYRQAAGTGLLSAPLVQVTAAFSAHHAEHGRAFAALAREEATANPNARLLGTVTGQIANATTEQAVLQIAFDIENALSATYLFALGALKDETTLRLAASILPVESQHAVAIGQAMGKTLEECVPAFENQDRAVDPAKFPTTTTTTTTTTTK